MLSLRKINKNDAMAEWEFVSNLPENENGLTNPYHGISWQDFIDDALPILIGYGEGKNLPAGYVPETYYYLWDDDVLIGEFRIRHYLVDSLRNGSGHIGYGIKKEFRNKGYATKGLALTIEKAKKIIPEDEIYMRVRKSNPASLAVMKKNGAYIAGEDENVFFTRIKIR